MDDMEDVELECLSSACGHIAAMARVMADAHNTTDEPQTVGNSMWLMPAKRRAASLAMLLGSLMEKSDSPDLREVGFGLVAGAAASIGYGVILHDISRNMRGRVCVVRRWRKVRRWRP